MCVLMYVRVHISTNFLGSITEIWKNEVWICLYQDSHIFGWQTVCKDIQHVTHMYGTAQV